MPPSLAETAPRRKPAHLLRLYEFLLRAQKTSNPQGTPYKKKQRRDGGAARVKRRDGAINRGARENGEK